MIWNGLLSVLHVYFQEQSSRWEVTLLTFHSECVKQPRGSIFVMQGRDLFSLAFLSVHLSVAAHGSLRGFVIVQKKVLCDVYIAELGVASCALVIAMREEFDIQLGGD